MSTDDVMQSNNLSQLVRQGGTAQPRKSIGSQLFLAVMGGVTVGLGLLTWGFYQGLESRTLKLTAKSLNVEVTALDGQLQSGESFLKSLAAATSALHNSNVGSPEAYRQLVQSFMQARPELITGFGIMQTPNGLVSNSKWFAPYIEETVSGRGTPFPNNPKFSFVELFSVENYPTQDYYKAPLASKKLVWTKPYYSEGFPIPLTTFAGPIKDVQGNTIAVMNGDVSLIDLQKIAKRTVYEGSGYFVALTPEGNLLAYPPNPKQAAALAKVADVSELKPIWDNVQEGLAKGQTAGLVTKGTSGSYWFYQQVPTTKWILLAQVPIASITSSALLASLASTVLAGFLIAGIVAWFVRSLNRRLNPIMEECARLTGLDDADLLANQDELERLSFAFFNLVDEQKRLSALQSADMGRSEMMRTFVVNLSQAVSSDAVQYSAIYNIQQSLGVDRILMVRLQPDGTGQIVQQIASRPWSAIDDQVALIPFTLEDGVQFYQDRQLRMIANVQELQVSTLVKEQAKGLDIQASASVPLFVDNQLWGLLVLHQCQSPRHWEPAEIDLLTQISSQVGLSLERALLIEQAEKLARDRLQDKEAIQNQLIQLIGSIEGVAMGDLTVRAEVEGAMGTVGDFFNAIVESLRSIVTQVKQSAEKVNSSVTSNETAIRQLAEDALQQVAEVNQTLDSIQNMTVTMQTVANSAQQAAQVAHSVSATARTGEVAMDSSVASILGLRGTIAETSKKVKRLGESSQQISKAVVLINQLATKTKLLAINASIEAALAGESGQGFAVVAEEVGQLAAQSASATQDIAKIVDVIQKEVSDVVQAMEEGTLQVVEGTKLVEETRQSLGQVLEVSRQIDALVESISNATVAQVESSATVTHLMQQIASVSEQTAGTSRQVSDALHETVSVAEQLQASVGTFKL